jgi:hypothetical protein
LLSALSVSTVSATPGQLEQHEGFVRRRQLALRPVGLRNDDKDDAKRPSREHSLLRLPRACLGNAYRFYPETRKENADSRT